MEQFKSIKDIRVFVTEAETEPLPSKADKASCPPCIKKMAESPFCGDELVDSFMCFQTKQKSKEDLDDCAQAFKAFRTCMMTSPIRFYDALYMTPKKLQAQKELEQQQQQQ
ncbi:hypothetical protein CYY_007269 [Polysphondylium violaceum]|uniref:GCK domain-containing protein n=1 Tax=Polysphondylium violaceum TaxID=133409 RepID=A0A8J4PR72_9MYCE|nr:hypothetical protein CYY_007269 [Polysphondylium violaceum]